MVMYVEMDSKQKGVALAVRNDVMRKMKVSVRMATRHFMEIGMRDSGEAKIASIYVPPESSKHYNDKNLEIMSEWAREVDACAGDLNWRRRGWVGAAS